VTGRQERRRMQLLDNFKETRGYFKLKEEAPDRTLRRTRCGRRYGPVVKQTTELTNNKKLISWVVIKMCFKVQWKSVLSTTLKI